MLRGLPRIYSLNLDDKILQDAFNKGGKVTVSAQVKPNGNTVHISWSQDLEAWAVASRNASVIAKDVKQVTTQYSENGVCKLARRMAICWLGMFDSKSANEQS